jgi:lysophospholipase
MMNNIHVVQGHLNNSRAKRLFYQGWHSEKSVASIVLVHGVGEHSGRYKECAEFFASRGIDVFAFDLEGFGRSEGKRGHIDDFAYYAEDLKDFIRYVANTFKPHKLFLMGHSLGAIICLDMLCDNSDIQLSGLVLSGPPFRLNLTAAEWFRKCASVIASCFPALTFEERSIQINMLTHDEQKKKEFMQDPLRHYKRSLRLIREFFKAEKRACTHSEIINLPLLIIQGGEDKIIDVKRVEEFYHAVAREDKMLIIYPEMYHEVLNEIDRQRVYRDVLRWIQDAKKRNFYFPVQNKQG